MSSLPDGGRHREAQALPLPRMVRSQTGDSRGLQKVGAKSKNLNKGVKVANSTHQKSPTTLWQAEGDGWKAREETVHGRRMGKTSGMTLSIKEPLPQQSSSSAREDEEDHWVVMEDRRRRRTAFENLAKGMPRYLDKSNDVEVGITELQERVEVPLQVGISIQQVAQQAMNEHGQEMFEMFWQEEEELCIASWARWDAQRKGLVDLERSCHDTSRETQMLNKRQETFQNAIEGKFRVQDRAGERLQDQIIEEIKELVSTKDTRSLTRKGRSKNNCRASGNRGRMRIWLGHHQGKSRTGQAVGGRGDKDGRKRVEAGA